VRNSWRSEVFAAVSLLVAVVAVYYAWRAADLGYLEGNERALRMLVEAVDVVRGSAEAVVAAYDGGGDRAEQNAATADLRQAQRRLRLVLAGGQLPAEITSSARCAGGAASGTSSTSRAPRGRSRSRTRVASRRSSGACSATAATSKW
jgi:hypothetical protein